MARLIIDTGTAGNQATGDTIRVAMGKINDNFDQLFSSNLGSGVITNTNTNGNVVIQPNGTGIVEVDQLTVNNSTVSPIGTNSDLTLGVNGTGNVVVNDDRIIITETKTATGVGSAGDRKGSISYDGTNLYVCTANYDGSTAIWKKLVLQAI